MPRRTYTPEFKREAVRLVTDLGLSQKQVARDLGLDPSTLRAWIQQLNDDPERGFPGHGHARDEEMRKLRREVETLRQERDVLKKAIGIFSRMPLR